jgi:ankyrin repeat protein
MQTTFFLKIFIILIIYVHNLTAQENSLQQNKYSTIPFHDKNYNNSLMQAIINGDLEEAKKLIVSGINLNEQNFLEQTALTLAIEKNYLELATLMLEYNANPNIKDYNGKTALDILEQSNTNNQLDKNSIVFLNELLQHGACIDLNYPEWNDLMQAAFRGDFKLVKCLLEQKVNPNIATSNGGSALVCALEQNHSDIVNILLNFGANPDIKIRNGNLLYYAILYGNTTIIKMLLAKLKNIEKLDLKCSYFLAFSLDRIDLIQILDNFDPNLKNDSIVLSLIALHENNNIKLKYYTENEIFDLRQHSTTIVNHCINNNNKDLLTFLIEQGLSLTQLEKDYFLLPEYSFLVKAVKKGNIPLVKFLLEHGIKINDKNGYLALREALRNNQFDLFDILLAHGASRETALNLKFFDAIEKQDIQKVEKLLKKGANLKSTECINGNNLTPLMQAAKTGNLELVNLLINHGADVNYCNIDHESALSIAIKENQTAIVELLKNQCLDCILNEQLIKKIDYIIRCNLYKIKNIHQILDTNSRDLIIKILNKYPNLNCNNSMLGYAAANNDYEFLSILINYGIDIN